MYALNWKADKLIDQFKARLMVEGFMQWESIYHTKTFS